ncbi:hypothetical protein HNR10_000768 [Nocardiopsis aegyptia]|uniref:Uncharacterized protein n=1 Tax=Nocardiopsis aegyptia TaxID=220378 RepID=A0A7Z0EIT8_9ACTN|nr:hypothetical protein [Nocardiopsis aegyptia]
MRLYPDGRVQSIHGSTDDVLRVYREISATHRTENRLSGDVSGTVVQIGSLYGNVSLPATGKTSNDKPSEGEAASPKVSLVCCLCQEHIPSSSDVYPLDAEWQRRHPNMIGFLACRCATDARWHWRCRSTWRGYLRGHIRSQFERRCVDSLSHIEAPRTHAVAALRYPASALLQGAEEYLRHAASDPRTPKTLTARLHASLEEWEANNT